MFEPEFLAMMTQTVRVTQSLGHDAYGQDAFAPTSAVLPCHVEAKAVAVNTVAGNVVYSAGVLYTPVNESLTVGDRYEIPDPTEPTGMRDVDVISIIVRFDEDGPHHMVIYYGEAT